MTKNDQEWFDNWKANGLKEMERKRKIPKATKKQKAAFDAIMKGAK